MLFVVFCYIVICLFVNRDYFYGRKIIYLEDLKEKPDLSLENKKRIIYEPFRISKYVVHDVSFCDLVCKKSDDTVKIAKCISEELTKKIKCEHDFAKCMSEKNKESLNECEQIKEECKEECKQYNCYKEIERLKTAIKECKEDCKKNVDEFNNLPKSCKDYIATISLDSFGEEHEKRVDESRKECLKDRIKLIWSN